MPPENEETTTTTPEAMATPGVTVEQVDQHLVPMEDQIGAALETRLAAGRPVTQQASDQPAAPDGGEGAEPGDGTPQTAAAPPEGSEPAAPPTTSPGSPAADIVEFEGVQISREELRSILAFREWATRNPDSVQALSDYLEGRAQIVPVQQPGAAGTQQAAPATAAAPAVSPVGGAQPSPITSPPAVQLDPAELEELPETVRAIVQAVPSLQQQLSTLLQAQTEDRRRQLEDRQRQFVADVGVGSQAFAAARELNDEQIQTLLADVRDMAILPALAEKVGSVQEATKKALEVAYFARPEFQQREVDKAVQTHATATTRGRKASKLSGSSGSIPRGSERIPESREDRVAAMAAEIREAISAGGAG